jgi:hypothetical protein
MYYYKGIITFQCAKNDNMQIGIKYQVQEKALEFSWLLNCFMVVWMKIFT